jgi:DNA or RNA helicases of superfamily II
MMSCLVAGSVRFYLEKSSKGDEMLLEHQRKAVESFNGYSYLAWETGTGKTLTALKIAEQFHNVLILCPASVIQVWESEIRKWSIYLKRYKIVSYDKFRLYHQKILKERYWDFVIFDEAHKLKSIRAKITKLIMKIFPKTYKVMLSGTPFEKPEDYYTQLRILRHDHPFHEISWTQYKDAFFDVDTMFHYIRGFRPGIKEKFIRNMFCHMFGF